MKKEDDGQELIDLNEQGRNDINEEDNEKQNKSNNNKNKYNYKKIIFILASILFVIIIIVICFLVFSKKFKMKQKELIIFDFDKTISFKDVFEEQRFLLPTREEQEDVMERMYYENWTLLMSSVYDRFYDLNITISDINNYIDTIEYNKGMIELLQYLEKHKDKYSLVILSAGHYYQIIRMLMRINMTELFDEIIAIPSYIQNNKIIVTQTYEHKCDICNVGQCKTFEYNLLIDKFKNIKNTIFNKVYYICDGLNDYCLARNLKKNDELLVKKGYTLYESLYKDGKIKNIKCKVDSWNDGFDVLKYFQEKEK